VLIYLHAIIARAKVTYARGKAEHAASIMLFHTGWFVESLATQTLVIFVIRTAGRPWRDRPSVALTASTLIIVAAGILLPFSPLGGDLGFVTVPPEFLVFLAAATATYLALVELVKRRLMHQLVA
jgi:Mg2+-importing ATPase